MNRRSILRFLGLASVSVPFKAAAAPLMFGADVTSEGITVSGLGGTRRFGFNTPFDAAGERVVLLKGASAGKTEMLLECIGWQRDPAAGLMHVPSRPWSPPVVVEVAA